MKRSLLLAVALTAVAGTLLAVAGACGGGEEKAATEAPGAALVSHEAGAEHPLQPKRLEAAVEIDMYEFYFANSQGEKNPTFTLPAGKTVGIHIHNEGGIVHELAIGRNLKEGAYEEILTELVPSDLFFYYGDVKAEIEDAEFGELEVEPGVRDIWIRMTIPTELSGEWELGCFVEGHYENGMHAVLIAE
jgi:uncharacterized cupredoxin-like copper-binding protein